MPATYLTGEDPAARLQLLIGRAREAALAGRRVLWVGLPPQRAHIYRHITRQGGVAGFEFVSEQQLLYRLMYTAGHFRPLCVGTERLALIAEALHQVTGRLPGAGEARLYAAGAAEIKRFGARLKPFDAETSRLEEVLEAYSQLKGDAWDYDDYRQEAALLASGPGLDPEADLVIVAGFRELLPLSLEVFNGLTAEVTISLPGQEGGAVVPSGDYRVTGYVARNEIEELRWILRDIKRHLHEGMDPADMALVIPAGRLPGALALAGEYGVPLMDETPMSLAETAAGRTLVELLALRDYVTAAGLMLLPGLAGLAARALDERIAGTDAFMNLAVRMDREDEGGRAAALGTWLRRVNVDGRQPQEQAAVLVTAVLEEILPERQRPDPAGAERFRQQALKCAAEAAQLGNPEAFMPWWQALLTESLLPREAAAGVAVMPPEMAGGRHYVQAWLAGAVEGAYVGGSTEDWFVPEEHRGGQLPLRHRGQEQLQLMEFRSIASHMTVTWSAGTQEGRQLPQAGLVPAESLPLPDQPAAAVFELATPAQLPAATDPLNATGLPRMHLEALRHYATCPFRSWARSLTGADRPPAEAWQQLIRSLRSGEAAPQLAEEHPWAAAWLEAYAPLLSQLHGGQWLPRTAEHPARLDLSGRIDGVVHVYHLVRPQQLSPGEARDIVRNRWSERYFAGWMAENGNECRLFVWPVLGEPVEVPRGTGYDRWLLAGRGEREAAAERHARGDIAPAPALHVCRTCEVFDVCRKGVR